jgi:hypothetical protein
LNDLKVLQRRTECLYSIIWVGIARTLILYNVTYDIDMLKLCVQIFKAGAEAASKLFFYWSEMFQNCYKKEENFDNMSCLSPSRVK